jgi:hypothetical protein
MNCKRTSRRTWGAIPVFLLLCAGHIAAQEYPARYMGGPAELATAPNGAVINAEVL